MKQKNFHETKALLLKLILSVFLLIPAGLSAQVTIGSGKIPEAYSVLELISNNTMGMRLPQMTTAERNAMQATFGAGTTTEAKGLVIYNTTNDCVEYWNKTRWVSLCEGSSQMTISPQPCQAVAADGTDCDEVFSITDPDCENGPFSFAVVAGADYASLMDVNEADGNFRIAFLPNNSINPRSAVVRVTSSCTGLYSDFLFTQVGDSCESLGTAPGITAVPSGKNISLCAEGAVYLSVPAATPNLDRLIWTRNNIEVARGVNSLAVTQEGIYDVWMGFIGCGNLAGNAVTVTKDGTGAPDPIAILTVGNNGLVCGPSGTTTLIAQGSTTGTVRWFKDGVLQPLTTPDNTIDNAGVGIWTAAVNSGGCWSKPSDAATVTVDPNGSTPITMPVIESNGAFCAGGSVYLSVSSASYNPAYTYTWYENNTQIGTGQNILYNVPTGVNSVVIRCRATQSGSCAAEAIGEKTITMGTVPARPVITGNSVLCSGTATLNVIPAGGGTYTYTWYKDDQPIGTTQSISITSGGNYYASVTEVGGCTSPLAYRNIPDNTSATPTVTLNRSNENPTLNDMVTYTVSINFPPATGYTWTVTNATLVSGGNGTASAVVQFDQTGAASVSVEVSNACGTGSATHSIANVATACADPETVSPSAGTMLNTVEGKGITLGPVSATFEGGATPSVSYQWYKNASASNTGGTVISGATNNTYIVSPSVGTEYYYCEVKNAGCTSSTLASGVYTVTADPDPANLPLGSGKFEGRTCFDVVETNNGGDCGQLTSRQSQKANFTQTATNTQTYTFTTSGAVSKIRFYAVDQTGLVIESITPGSTSWATDTNLNGTYTVTVKYKTDLNSVAAGKDRANALTAMLYVVYNDNAATGGGTDRHLELKVSIQDCTCCPGYLAVGKEYVQKTPGYLSSIGSGSKFATVVTYFNATGNDVCFYKNEAAMTTVFSVAKSTCAAMTDNGTGWRLPTIAELGSIQSVATTLSSQPTSIAGTANMVNTPLSGAGAYYWSSTEMNASVTWGWSYAQEQTQMVSSSTSTRVRCVKTQ